MSETSDRRSADFLRISGQFKLGHLVTEASHPVTARLSDVAREDIAKALDLLFQVDGDVLAKYREFAASGRAVEIKNALLGSLKNGGRIFFTGCGSTGRLSIQLVSLWRDFWQRQRARGFAGSPSAEDWERRACSVMAGGDFALIKSVEGFEDFAAFGRKQLGDLGVSARDVVFAITEGGETSFVIGTAWQALEAGAKTYFVYNNPDETLCRHIERSREILAEPRIEKINLATGPMAITGSTRMQATTIQLCVLLTVLEMTLRDLMRELEPGGPCALESAPVPGQFSEALARMLGALRGPEFLAQLAALVALEESVYRAGRRNNYFSDAFALDVLTDTTERSPTYCTPPFRKFDDETAAESWAFLFTPEPESARAWERLLKRPPRCVEWSDEELRALVSGETLPRTREVLRRIGRDELLRFRIGQDGLTRRAPGPGDGAIAIAGASDARESGNRRAEQPAPEPGRDALACLPAGRPRVQADRPVGPARFMENRLAEARAAGAKSGLIWVGEPFSAGRELASRHAGCAAVFIPAPADESLLNGLQHVGLKLVLNALSTCTMVRLGRVMGNTMIWVVASNLKLIDRATRYVAALSGLNYEAANRLLFEVIEYVEPRMKSDRAYPPVVGLAVLRARHGLTNEQAERRF